MYRPALTLLLAFCCGPFVPTSGLAQSVSAGADPVEVSVYATGVRRFEPGKWSVVGLLGENRGETDGEAMIAVYFDHDSWLQHARRFWVPAGAVRTTWLPVLAPKTIPRDRGFADLTSLRLDRSSDREVLRRRSGEPMVRQAVLKVDHEQVKTGAIFGKPWAGPAAESPQLDGDAYELIVSSRAAMDHSRVTIDLSADFLPPFPFALEGLDQIILCSDHVAADSAGLVALRNWLQHGGRLWIMLDRVGEDVVQHLLGHAAALEVVDRVQLNAFSIEDVSRPEETETPEDRRFEKPIELVRVVTDSTDIQCRVNGWPAAFWQPVGEGEVLFTTMAARGWLYHRSELDSYEYQKYTRINLIPTKALTSVASRFYQPNEPKQLSPGELGPLLEEQIGYAIPSRKVAASVLGLNCIGLLGVGVWLARRRRLERLAWAVPAITLAATLVLLAIGSSNAKRVAPTVAVTQIVRVAPETNDMHLSGAAAVYNQVTSEVAVRAVRGGLVLPNMGEFSGVTKRLVWDDHGGGQWQNLQLPSGTVRMFAMEQFRTLPVPIVARGEFGPDGFTGQISGDLPEEVSDALIAAPPAPRLAVLIEKDGSFQGGSDQVLARDQYLAGTLLTDEQRRRQAVYRRMLDPVQATRSSKRPTLFFWSPALESGFDFPKDFRLTGAALMAIPLQIDRTPLGTKFHIPSSFLRIESVKGPSGKSSAFNARTGQWTRRLTMPTRAYLRFVLPEQVLPCRLEGGFLTVKVNAPSRTLEISGMKDGQYVVVERVHNPSGVLKFAIDRADMLQMDEGGGLLLGIAVSKTDDELAPGTGSGSGTAQELKSFIGRSLGEGAGAGRKRAGRAAFDDNTWQIDYVRLDVTGETL